MQYDHAQGGIAAAIDTLDSFEAHIEDTYQAGAGLGKRKVISEIISSGPKLIQYLIDLGTEFYAERSELRYLPGKFISYYGKEVIPVGELPTQLILPAIKLWKH